MDITLMLVLVGIVASVLTSLVKQEKWSDKTKQSVSAALSLIGGTVAVMLSEKNVTPEQVLGAWAATQGISQVVFAYLLKETGLDKILASIGAKKQ